MYGAWATVFLFLSAFLFFFPWETFRGQLSNDGRPLLHMGTQYRFSYSFLRAVKCLFVVLLWLLRGFVWWLIQGLAYSEIDL